MGSTQETLDAIAYVAWHDITVTDESLGKVSVRLPARDDLLNYVGTGHAGALYTLAETAAGVAANGLAQTLNGFILLKQATVNYTRRAVGALNATGKTDADAWRKAQESFSNDERAELPIEVVIQDGESNPVFSGTFLYALRLIRS
jgi:acyl-coenzyme A thioesterase PaaI-like protein